MPTSSPTVFPPSLSLWEPRELASSASFPHPLEQQGVMYRVSWEQGREDGDSDGLHMVFRELRCLT